MDTRYIIELQKEKINHLENKINRIESTESNLYGLTSKPVNCTYDIEIDWTGSVSVKYKANDEHIRSLADKLGYSTDEMTEFLGVDKMIPYKIHPIHGLRTKKQKEYMLKSVQNYIKFFKNIELTTTSITVDMPVTYVHKKGHQIHCLNTYAVNYLKKVLVRASITIKIIIYNLAYYLLPIILHPILYFFDYY